MLVGTAGAIGAQRLRESLGQRGRRAGGFTVLELGVALLVALSFVAVFLPLTSRTCCGSRQIKDATQVRNIVWSLGLFAQGSYDQYPLPSSLDPDNLTTLEDGREKDTTGNILSVLIFNQFISPEIAVSPAEVSPVIKIHTDYATSAPAAAVEPKRALWDPSFTADWTKPGGGNISFATLEISDAMPGDDSRASRKHKWSLTINATEAVVGNRGPAVTMGTAGGKRAWTVNPQSNSLAILGSRTTWEGNIGYNDGHVNFEQRVDPAEIIYSPSGARALPDCLFADEADDRTGSNIYLGVWIKGGAARGGSVGLLD